MTKKKEGSALEYMREVNREWNRKGNNNRELGIALERSSVVSDKFKEKTIGEIKESFSRNEKKAKEEDSRYMAGLSILKEMNRKNEEIERIEIEIEDKKKEIKEKKMRIETFQYKGVGKVEIEREQEQLNRLNEEVDEIRRDITQLEKDLEDKKRELNEMEKEYGKRDENIGKLGEKNRENVRGSIISEDSKPDIIQGYRIDTVKKLWENDRIRCEILDLLEEGTGVDDDIRDMIVDAVNKGFKKYHDKKESDLGMKMGRYLKNKYIKLSFDKIGKIKDSGSELMFFAKNGDRWVLIELGEDGWEQIGGENDEEIVDVERKGGILLLKCKNGDKYIMKYLLNNKWIQVPGEYDSIFEIVEIGGNLLLKCEKGGKLVMMYLSDGKRVVIPGEYDWISDISDIGGKFLFIAKVGEKYMVFWGNSLCGGAFDEVGEINNLGGEPVFWAKIGRKYVIMRGKEKLGEYNEILEIEKTDGKLVFKVRNSAKWSVVQVGENLFEKRDIEKSDDIIVDKDEEGENGEQEQKVEIGDIMRIGGRMVKVEFDGGEYFVKRGDEQLGGKYKEIGKIKEVAGKPVFKARDEDGWFVMVGTERQRGSYEYIGEIHDYKGKVLYRVKNVSGGWEAILNGFSYGKERYISEFFKYGGEVFYFEQDYSQTYMFKGFGGHSVWRCERGFGVLCEDGSDLDFYKFDNELEDNSMKKIGGNYVFIAYAWGIDEWKDNNGVHYGKTYDYDEVFCFDEKGKYKTICSGDKGGSDKEHLFFKTVKKIGKNIVFIGSVGRKQIAYLWSEQQGGEYDEISEIEELGGKLLMKCKNGDKCVVVWGGEQCGGEYDEISEIEEIGGKPMFKARKGNKRLVFWGKEQQGKEYDEIRDVKIINGKLAFKARIGDKWIVVWGKKQYGGKYDEIGEVVEVGGEPVFRGRCGERWVVFPLYEEKTDTGGYDDVSKIEMICGKPIVSLKMGEKYIIMRGNEQIGGEYDEIIEIIDGGSGPIIRARSRNREYLIIPRKDPYLINVKGRERTRKKVKEGNSDKLIERVERFENEWLERKANIEGVLLTMGELGSISGEVEKMKRKVMEDFEKNYETAKSKFEGYEEAQRLLVDMSKLEDEYMKNEVLIKEKRAEVKEDLDIVTSEMEGMVRSGINLEDESLLNRFILWKNGRRWNKLERKQQKIKNEVGVLYKRKMQILHEINEIEEKYGRRKMGVDSEKKGKRGGLSVKKVEMDEKGKEIPLNLYKIRHKQMIEKYEMYVEGLMEEVKGLDMGIGEEGKEKLIELLRRGLLDEIDRYKQDKLLEYADQIQKYLEDNERRLKDELRMMKGKINDIYEELDELQQKIEKEKEKKIGSKGGEYDINEVLNLRNLEGELRLELASLMNEYNDKKGKLEEIVMRYRGEGLGEEFDISI